ncbi:MAG: hypothetical protein J5I59_12945 [Saprospiraceae bacterium]|nr:hypothetical protein [Saprospiraceae bacterium]
MDIIESTGNQKFKHLLRLSTDNHFRRKSRLIFVEGRKEIEVALRYGYEIDSLYVDERCPETVSLDDMGIGRAIVLHHKLFKQLVYREDASNMVALFKEPELPLSRIRLPEFPLIVILEGVEKPGNIGAILRTCDAVKADAVVVTQKNHSFFHPNTIRSSVGTVFSLSIACAEEDEVLTWCRDNRIKVYSAALQTNLDYTMPDYRSGSAFVMGAEDKGLKPFWRQSSDAIIRIPMLGHNDSLNVSVSAAVLLYEALRQRRQLGDGIEMKGI